MRRTTMALEDDVLARLRQRASAEGTSLARLANRLLDRGLEMVDYHDHAPMKWPSFESGQPRVPFVSRSDLYDTLERL